MISGSYHALALGAQRSLAPDESVADPGDTERLAAQLLSQVAHGYGGRWDVGEGELAGSPGRGGPSPPAQPRPGQSLALRVEQVLGLPFGFRFDGVTLGRRPAGSGALEPVRHPLGRLWIGCASRPSTARPWNG